MRLPRNFDTDKFTKNLSKLWSALTFTWDSKLKQPERPMPFRLDLGTCGILFVICFCGREESVPATGFPRAWFHLADLDSLVEACKVWDGEGGHRHHAGFFDWEADRWIELSRWKGCKAGLRTAKGSAETSQQKRAEGGSGKLFLRGNDELVKALRFYSSHLRTFGL